MTELCQYVDVCIGNEEDADTTLGFKAAHTDVTKGELNLDGFKDVFKQMKEKFGFKFIASSLRESHSASDNGWSALVYDGTEFYHTKKYNVRIVDRVGSGDSFASGLIYGLVTGMPMADAAELAYIESDKDDMLWVPGCMTPTEIIKAESLGAKFVKLFPGNLLGPDFMSAIKELFPNVLFMPTGGVDTSKENIAGWFKSGVCAVGMGSKLVSKALLEAKDYAKIESLTKEVLATIKEVRGK